ncbi:glycosyltransferase family 2 protein [Reichenbachiella agarivorans]|uniref:Glycosyltransferase family 2 protein n=1 Tax=Reichenbachiella agarivorans TaxID=2979464 RepID=A0ABY6CSJ9_9BACT|nr:glycosyltransferase family 2 protein [Reichenbachiella agarivorans]UXP32423.1 glycosyltransferase family 2 protein [Reichenbachiella agarivorans]
MSTTQPLVSVISVNYNEPEETELFLESLYQSDYHNFETLLVDNGSKRNIDPSVENRYSNLSLIVSEKNLGFAGGNNLGVAKAKGKYLIFLNNDTLLPRDFIDKLVMFMETHPEAGMVSPKIVFPNGKIQYAGSLDINGITGRGKRIGYLEEDHGQYDKNYPTDLPHGAAMIVPAKVISEVGSMYEEYFLYYEEHDWSMAIKRAGYKIYFFGETNIIHKQSISVGIDSPLKVYYMSRNRLLFQKRNFSPFNTVLSVLFYSFFALPKSSIKYLSSGKTAQFKNLWRGYLWHLNKNYVFKG